MDIKKLYIFLQNKFKNEYHIYINSFHSKTNKIFILVKNKNNKYFGEICRSGKFLLNNPIKSLNFDGFEDHTFDMIISTISPEIIMDFAYGELMWAGRDFFKIVLPVESVFPKEVYFLYYAGNEPFTRIVEYKKFYHNESPHTLLGIEIPSTRNKLYPYPVKSQQAIHQKYIDSLPENVFSIGRNGSYRYLDVGLTIEQCMDVFKDV